MRKPLAALTLVHAETLQPVVEVPCERWGTAVEIAENEHSNTPGLAVAICDKLDSTGRPRGLAKGRDDGTDIARGAAPQERKRDVQVLARYQANLLRGRERDRLPSLHRIEDAVGKA